LASQVISHYRLIKKLGAGGMGEVYLAEDIGLERKVAIKLLPAAYMGDELARKRLIREARAAGTLDHPNICPVYEVGTEGDKTFIAMQYVEGVTLHSRIETDPPTLEQAIVISAQVADALVEAHYHGIVHRDIKPQNIMLTDRGRVKVLDFGLAKFVEPVGNAEGETLSQLTTVGTAVGTVPYMSPEQVKGDRVDVRSDLFSLGVVLYECVTGRRPFTGSSPIEICAEIIHTEQRSAAESNAGIPPDLDRILTRALKKSPEARYQSAEEMLADLRGLCEAPTTDSAASTRFFPLKDTGGIAPSRFLRRRPVALLGILALSIIAIVAIGLALRFWRAGPHQPSAEARRFYEMGTDSIRNRSYYEASKVLERAVALDGKYALAHARLAEAYSEIDQTEKAKDELLVVNSLVPDRGALGRADAMYLDAIAATVRREFGLAIDLYRRWNSKTRWTPL
jgi:tRNA A-37 threonylcarbamoyl transferase component Bud32